MERGEELVGSRVERDRELIRGGEYASLRLELRAGHRINEHRNTAMASKCACLLGIADRGVCRSSAPLARREVFDPVAMSRSRLRHARVAPTPHLPRGGVAGLCSRWFHSGVGLSSFTDPMEIVRQ